MRHLFTAELIVGLALSFSACKTNNVGNSEVAGVGPTAYNEWNTKPIAGLDYLFGFTLQEHGVIAPEVDAAPLCAGITPIPTASVDPTHLLIWMNKNMACSPKDLVSTTPVLALPLNIRRKFLTLHGRINAEITSVNLGTVGTATLFLKEDGSHQSQVSSLCNDAFEHHCQLSWDQQSGKVSVLSPKEIEDLKKQQTALEKARQDAEAQAAMDKKLEEDVAMTRNILGPEAAARQRARRAASKKPWSVTMGTRFVGRIYDVRHRVLSINRASGRMQFSADPKQAVSVRAIIRSNQTIAAETGLTSDSLSIRNLRGFPANKFYVVDYVYVVDSNVMFDGVATRGRNANSFTSYLPEPGPDFSLYRHLGLDTIEIGNLKTCFEVDDLGYVAVAPCTQLDNQAFTVQTAPTSLPWE